MVDHATSYGVPYQTSHVRVYHSWNELRNRDHSHNTNILVWSKDQHSVDVLSYNQYGYTQDLDYSMIQLQSILWPIKDMANIMSCHENKYFKYINHARNSTLYLWILYRKIIKIWNSRNIKVTHKMLKISNKITQKRKNNNISIDFIAWNDH